MSNAIQSMWVVGWTVSFDKKDDLLAVIEEKAARWVDALCVFEVDESPPSGVVDEDGLPIASLHTIEAYGRTDPYGEMKELWLLHPPSRVETVVDNPHWLEPLPPKQVGRFWIDARAQHQPGLWTLAIHTATAFGSGEHPTTLGCLTLMDELQLSRPKMESVLDLGSGSGILAIGAHYLWPEAEVHASDIDPEAVRITKRHADAHGADLQTYVSHGCRALKRQSFDLVVANILLNPLLDMSSDIACIGVQHLITAGILDYQFDELEKAYAPCWRVEEKWTRDGWVVTRWHRL